LVPAKMWKEVCRVEGTWRLEGRVLATSLAVRGRRMLVVENWRDCSMRGLSGEEVS
jgi:hypothetical protein